jgi:hypothetical protein
VSALAIGSITFCCVLGGAVLGMVLRGVLPAHHLTDESKDVVKLGTGLIATMAALVLGLLIASAKSSYDRQENELRQAAANIMLLDRTLGRYGPETQDIRRAIRGAIVLRLATLWPEDPAVPGRLEVPEMDTTVEGIGGAIRALPPRDEEHSHLLARALQIIGDLEQGRWLLFGGLGGSIPVPFLVILVFWITVIFTSFGLFAPRNGTVVTMLLVSALSISASIYLIVELDHPFNGLMKVSSAPLRFTLDHLGR